MNILLTGATGFVGSNLLPKLLEQGHQVTILTRNPSTIKIFHENISIVQGDILNAQDCLKALENIDLAFYLIHGLNESDHFEYKESLAALNFVKAANKQKLKKIIYLSALTSSREEEALSPHMRSRQLVGEILRLSNCEVIELRASIILGAGSISFEMIKALNERLPFLIESKLLKSPCQPLALEDLLTILLNCMNKSMGTKMIEIGGQEITTYQNLISLYAQIKGLNRKTIPIKFISKDVIAQFIDMVLPEYSTVGKKLFESIEHETTVNNDTDLKEILPKTHTLHEAMTTAISNSQTHYDPIWDKEFYNMIFNEKLLPEIYDHLGNFNAQELFKLVKNSTKLLRATKLF